MAVEVTDEIKTKILEFFQLKRKMLTTRDIAAGTGLENRVVKLAVTDLVNAGTLEFTSFGGATFIKLPEAA
jgi:hypothetical protein